MAAQTRIFQQTQDLGTLRELVDLIKDPKKIISAHEEARKQSGLTDDEARKAAEARDFIAKFNELNKTMKAREDAVIARETSVTQGEFVLNNLATEKKDYFDGMVTELDNRKKAIEVTEKEHKRISAELAEHKKGLDQDYANKLAELNKKAATDDKLRVVNEAEAVRLAELRQILEAKTAKFKEAAAL